MGVETVTGIFISILYLYTTCSTDVMQGLKLRFFSREFDCIFISFMKVLCISSSTSLGSLQKFEGTAGEFKAAFG